MGQATWGALLAPYANLVVSIDKRKLKKVVKNKETINIRKRVWKLKENNMKTRFQERVKELVDVDAPNL